MTMTATVRVSNPDDDMLVVGAALVEEGEVVMAERVGFLQRWWKVLGGVMCVSLVILATCLSVFLGAAAAAAAIGDGYDMRPTDALSAMPSSSPSFDTRPTLEIVQERGHVRCGRGLWSKRQSGADLYTDLCRSMAAVLFGNPDNTEEVIVTGSDRFQMLHGRDVDLLLYGDTHTIEREVHEKSTGSGFTFSSPYYYDGLSYYGDESFVKCAEQRKRYAECSSLRICTYEGSTTKDFLKTNFPSDFLEVAPSLVQAMEMMRDGKCKVMAANRMSLLLNIESSGDNLVGNFVVGEDVMTKEPYAVVTRNDHAEFSDIINWVVQALFYGEEQGLTKNSSRCQGYADLMGNITDLNFLNAVYCVGNYAEIFHGDESNRGLNRINNGSTGMLYAIPFGELKHEIDQEGDPVDTILHSIRNNGTLDCGIIIPDEYDDGEGTAREKLVGMSKDYCRTVAAALFNGNFESVNLWEFSEGDDDSYRALNNGTVDVLSGARIERKNDFRSSPSLGGFHFSTPYYYGNDTNG